MTDPALKRRKLGDILCDIGKYLLTVIPFTYLMADRAGAVYVILATALCGLLLICFGLYFVEHSVSVKSTGNSKKKKIRVLRNSVFVVEEEKEL